MNLSVEAADERDRPLPVAGFKGTPEEIERQWHKQGYRGRGNSIIAPWSSATTRILPAASLSFLPDGPLKTLERSLRLERTGHNR
jgi:hypothetical protein